MNEYGYSIQSSWSARPDEPFAIGRSFVKTLDALSPLDPLLESWLVADQETTDGVPLDIARRDIGDIVKGNVLRDDDDVPDARYGYGMFATSARYISSKWFGLSVTAGSPWHNEATLRAGDIGTPLDDSLIRYPIFKAALLALIANWPAPWAKVQAYKSEVEYVPHGPGFELKTKSEHRMTWLGYVCAERAAGLTLPSDLLIERTPDGGLLMIAAETRLDPANALQMKHSDVITDIMAQYGWAVMGQPG